MGSKLLFFISLALSLHRPSIAPWLEVHPLPATLPKSFPTRYTTLGDFKHGNLINYHVNPGLSTEQLLRVPIHEMFHDEKVQELVAHHVWTIKNPESMSPLSSTAPFTWIEDGKIYRKLEDNQKGNIDKFLEDYVIRTDHDKLVAQDMKWLMESEPTWWNQKFIEENLKNKQYKELVAIGDLLKFHREGTKLTPDYVVNELHPRLKEILVPDGNVRASSLNLKPLTEVKDENELSILAKRVGELENFLPDLEKGPEMLKMLRSVLPETSKPNTRRMRFMSHIIPTGQNP